MGYPRVKGRKVSPLATPEYRGRKHRMLQVVELHCITTDPCKVGDRSLAAFRTSVIFENDRVTAEVPSQC